MRAAQGVSRAVPSLVTPFLLPGDGVDLSVKTQGGAAPVFVLKHGGSAGGSVAPANAYAFIGRADELVSLGALIDDDRDPAMRLAAILGERGIGKTALVHEFALRMRAEGAGVAWMSAVEQMPAFFPWRAMLTSLARDEDSGELDSLSKEIHAEDPDRAAVFEQMSAFLHSASASRRLVLVFDDADRSDLASLELLKFLAGDLELSNVTAILNIRTPFGRDDPRLKEALEELIDRSVVLPLRGLSEPDVARMIETRVGADQAADRALLANIQDATAGNPALIGRICLALTTEGIERSADSSLPAQTSPQPNFMRLAAGARLIRFNDEVAKVKDSKGMRYIEILSQNPGRAFTASELVALAQGHGMRTVVLPDAGPVLDPRAKAEFRRRLHELEQEREEADANADLAAITRVDTEVQWISEQTKGCASLQPWSPTSSF